jgi:zinc protease
MFKSTKNMPSEMIDRLTEDVGGFNNATTFDDVTAYYEVVPSNYLETLLWAEAERHGRRSTSTRRTSSRSATW